MRVLHVIPDIGVSNGIMSVILNYAKAMPNDIIFDVVYLMDNPKDRRNDIELLGGRVYKLGDGPKDVLKMKFFEFFRNNKGMWQAVHIHIPYFSAFIVPFAKMFKIKKICCHCHSTLFSLNPNNEKINRILNLPTRFIVDKKFACGKEAGDYWYGSNYTVLKNAIDCEKFRFNPELRDSTRNRLNLGNSLVVGNIGRTDIIQKNHPFILEIFKEIKKINLNSKLLLIGGEKFEHLDKICIDYDIQDSVEFLGSRSDVDEILQVVDVFLFPSIREGLPVSVVEAQACGLSVLMSDSVTDDVIATDLVHCKSLNDNAKTWAEKCIELSYEKRKDTFEIMKKSGWDIFSNADVLVNYYRGKE